MGPTDSDTEVCFMCQGDPTISAGTHGSPREHQHGKQRRHRRGRLWNS